MKTAIYKYQIPVKEKVEIELPKNAQILRVDEVDGLNFLWAIVNTDENAEKEIRYLELYKTGAEITTPLRDLKYLGTCKLFVQMELCLYTFENTKKIML
jgi:hypothetical protein